MALFSFIVCFISWAEFWVNYLSPWIVIIVIPLSTLQQLKSYNLLTKSSFASFFSSFRENFFFCHYLFYAVILLHYVYSAYKCVEIVWSAYSLYLGLQDQVVLNNLFHGFVSKGFNFVSNMHMWPELPAFTKSLVIVSHSTHWKNWMIRLIQLFARFNGPYMHLLSFNVHASLVFPFIWPFLILRIRSSKIV